MQKEHDIIFTLAERLCELRAEKVFLSSEKWSIGYN
jgi:hypothetical protein